MIVSDLIAISNMADDNNQNVFAFPVSTNFKYARTGKDGWGEITIAIPNHMVSNIDKYVMSLYAADREEFRKYKENGKTSLDLKKIGDDVMAIISAALSGDCQKYLNYDLDGNKYCKWGIVEKDIRAIFYAAEPSESEGPEKGGDNAR